MPTLSIPDAIHRQLVARAAEQNTTVDDLATRLLAADVFPRSASERLFDAEYQAECEADTTPVPTLAEARAILAKLPVSLAAEIVAERDDR
ncbi:MAG TPA: hypothetical protein VH092_13905 [Urbifossiella sp.]|jgi:hypothetical protein|nr:hypothetical protein [Urbifossiella sp.]